MSSISAMMDFRHLGLCQKPSKCIYHKFCPIIANFGRHDHQAILDKTYRTDLSNSDRYIKFRTVWPGQPIKFNRKVAKQEVRQYLSSPLTYHNQTLYIDP